MVMEQESSASIYWRAAKEALEVVLQGLPVMLLMGDAILCSLIILKVPCKYLIPKMQQDLYSGISIKLFYSSL